MGPVEVTDRFPSNFYEALKGISYRAMSWNGFNLFGDEKSIDRLTTLVHNEASIETFWRPAYIKQQERIIQLEADKADLMKTLRQADTVLAEIERVVSGRKV